MSVTENTSHVGLTGYIRCVGEILCLQPAPCRVAAVTREIRIVISDDSRNIILTGDAAGVIKIRHCHGMISVTSAVVLRGIYVSNDTSHVGRARNRALVNKCREGKISSVQVNETYNSTGMLAALNGADIFAVRKDARGRCAARNTTNSPLTDYRTKIL